VVTADWLGIACLVGNPRLLAFVIGQRLGSVVHRNARIWTPPETQEIELVWDG
jgi:hypothetical protein